MDLSAGTQRLFAFLFGLFFLATMLGIAHLVPHPTEFQLLVFRIVLAMAAAGAAAMFPGALKLQVGGWITAGAAMVIFLVIYFVNPTRLVSEAPKEKQHEGLLSALQKHLNKYTPTDEFRLTLGDANNEELGRFWISSVSGKTWGEVFLKICDSYKTCLRCEPAASPASTAVRIEVSGPIKKDRSPEGVTIYSCGKGAESPAVDRTIYFLGRDGSAGPITAAITPSSRAADVAAVINNSLPSKLRLDAEDVLNLRLFDPGRDNFIAIPVPGSTVVILTNLPTATDVRFEFDRLMKAIKEQATQVKKPAPLSPPEVAKAKPQFFEPETLTRKLSEWGLQRIPLEGEAQACIASRSQMGFMLPFDRPGNYLLVGLAGVDAKDTEPVAARIVVSKTSADCPSVQGRVRGEWIVPAVCLVRVERPTTLQAQFSLEPPRPPSTRNLVAYDVECLKTAW